MNIEQARFNMVEQQIRTWEVLDPEVLELLYVVRREAFVPEQWRSLAFSDLEIPLGRNPGERMWSPKLEARSLQELGVKKTDRVLEVGSGSGYFAALLAHRAQHVTSVEINTGLVDLARGNLDAYGVENATVEQGDAAKGWPSRAPYDVIVLTGSTPQLTDDWLKQLKPGGRLFAILGEAPVMTARLITQGESGAPASLDLFETSLAPLVNAPARSRFSF